MDAWIVLRLALVLPAIFLVSYLVIGAIVAVVVAFWAWILGGLALVIGGLLLVAHVT